VIAKISRGWSAGNLLRYLMGPGRANEHVDQRVIATWDGAPELHQPQPNTSACGFDVGDLSRTGFDGDHQANREQDRMSAPRKFPDELRQRAVRLVRDAGAEPGTSRKEACRRVGQQLGISPETLRGWVNRAEIDDGDKPGVTTETATRIAELERENRELRRANAILKSASAFFAAELDRPSR